MTMKRFEMFAFACAAAFAAAAGERVLWPSADAELKAQRDSSIALLPDGSGRAFGVPPRLRLLQKDLVDALLGLAVV